MSKKSLSPRSEQERDVSFQKDILSRSEQRRDVSDRRRFDWEEYLRERARRQKWNGVFLFTAIAALLFVSAVLLQGKHYLLMGFGVAFIFGTDVFLSIPFPMGTGNILGRCEA